MKKTTKFISMVLSFLMIISSFNFAFAIPNAKYESIDLQRMSKSSVKSIDATDLFLDKNVGQRVFDLNSNNLIRSSMKETIAKGFGAESNLNAEEKKYVEDVALSLSKPVGVVDIEGSPNEYIDIVVWLQELPEALSRAYGVNSMSLTSSYDAIGSKARATIKSNYEFMSNNSSKSINSSAIRYEYFEVFSGFAMTVSVKEAKEIAKIPGVYAVTPDTLMYANKAIYNPDPSYALTGMGESREVLNISEIHDAGIDGTGVIVGVLDTGIDFNHPDLATVFKGGWNYISPSVDYGRPESLKNSPMETTYEQWQASGKPVENTNGSTYYTDHGTHVSGTIAARAINTESSATYKALGMAPNVDLYVARVLGPYGSGATSGIIMAIEDFAKGNVERGIPKADVINLSLGANNNTAYGDNIFALNNAVIAGVNVSVSAGNNATPATSNLMKDRAIKTLGSPGTAYLPVTVAAAQYGGTAKKIYNNVNVICNTSTGSAITGSAIIGLLVEGQDISNSFDNNIIAGNPAPVYVEGKGYELYLAFGVNDTNPTLADLQAIPDNSLEGKILVVKRGIAFTDFHAQALRTGAGALIIVNNVANGEAYITNMAIGGIKSNSLPIFSAFHSTSAKLTELAGEGNIVYVQLGNLIKEHLLKYPAYFSSIGPVNPTEGLKPDIIAPGWNIVSTAPAFITTKDNNATDYSAAYQSMSGTSMSAPHIAGILALMKQRYPSATPAEIKAILMNTSKVGFIKTTDGTVEYQASVYEVGAGFVDPYRAIMEEYNKDIYVTVTDDIPGQTAGTVIANQTLSSLSFGNTDKGINSKTLPVKVNGASTFDISVIYNNNTRYSKNATTNGVELKYSTPVNGEFNVWVESTVATTDGYYEGYIVITVEGKEYSMPWLVQVGKVEIPFDMMFFSERPIVSTSTDANVRSAGGVEPINSNSTTLYFSYSGTFTSDLDIFLVNAEAEEPDLNYYYGTLPMKGKSNDGKVLSRVGDAISSSALEIVEGMIGDEKTIANGVYYLVLAAHGKFYIYDDIGIVFTDGTGEYAVQFDLDSNILVDPDENVTTANVSGRIFSSALDKAANMGFIWTDKYDFWTSKKYYEIDQSFNILGFESLEDMYRNTSTDEKNLYAYLGDYYICDKEGYFDLSFNISQSDKNGGYPFNLNGNNSVVGLEGFYYNDNGVGFPLIGANKSVSVTPRYITSVVDKSMLNATIVTAQSKVKSKYTAQSWLVFVAALEEALAVSENSAATQEQVNQALLRLTNAINALVIVQEEEPWVPDPITPPASTTPSTPEPVKPVEFNDTTNHWAKDDIGFIAGLGLVNGTSLNNFSPDSNMNRGMIVTILGRLAKIDINNFTNSSSFNDVAVGQYYAPFIEWAAQLGLVNGTGNGGFSPEAPLTRVQLAHMLMKYAELMNLNLKSNTENKVQFADEDKVSSWASESVQKAREFGIIVGSNGNFDPERSITRAEVMTMLARFIRLIEQQ